MDVNEINLLFDLYVNDDLMITFMLLRMELEFCCRGTFDSLLDPGDYISKICPIQHV